MQYGSFLKLEDSEEISSLFKGRLPAYIAHGIVRLLQSLKSLGFDLKLEVPASLRDHPPQAWGALAALRALQEAGIINFISITPPQYPDEPRVYSTSIRYVHPAITSKDTVGHSGFSSSLFSQEATYWPAIGESLERWALDTYQPPADECTVASFDEIREHALDIFNIAGFSPKRDPRAPKYYYDASTRFTWIKGRSLISKEKLYIPLQLIGFRHREKRTEPLLVPGISTGAASGQTLSHALTSAILEIIERDALMINWLNQLPCERIDLDTITDERVQNLVKIARRYRLEICALRLFTDMPVHAILVFLIDHTGVGPAVIADSKTGFSFIETLVKALDQTLSTRPVTRNLMDLNTEIIPQLDPRTLGHRERFLYWSSPEHTHTLDFWLTTTPPAKATPIIDFDAGETYEARLKFLLDTFAKKHYEVIYKEILEKEVGDLAGGIRSVVVRIPLMQPMSLHEKEPCLFGERLRQVPGSLGLSLRIPVFTDTPHPFP